MKIRAIRKGEPYNGRSAPSGCYPRRAPADGLLLVSDGVDGDEFVPAELVQIELDSLKPRPKKSGKKG